MAKSKPTLKPQVPGAIPGVVHADLALILAMSVVDIVAGLAGLTDAELGELTTLEAAGESRADVLQAITVEQMNRYEAGADATAALPLPRDPNAPAPLGALDSHAHLHADQVDPRSIERAVLTRDGWVLPHPKLAAE